MVTCALFAWLWVIYDTYIPTYDLCAFFTYWSMWLEQTDGQTLTQSDQDWT